MEVDDTRDMIRTLDEQIIRLAAERIRLAEELGRMKDHSGAPISDFSQEALVLSRAREISKAQGISPLLGEDLLHRLIEEAVVVQETDRIRRDPFADGHVAVVYGGAGRMGVWMANFLATQGLQVHVQDPARGLVVDPATLSSAEWIFMATPPNETARLYQSWVEHPPTAILCDLCSIKTPLRDALEALVENGARITSAHPMFGPSTRMLRDHDIVISPCGNEEADGELINLLGSTSARLIMVPLDQHDEWMADALALAHASAMTFAHALGDDPQPFRSETLGIALDMAEGVVHESPDVYFEIQAHNPHTLESLRRLKDSITEFEAIVSNMDRRAFEVYMQTAARRVQAHRSEP